MAKSKRKDGYYWVRYRDWWEPALWLGGALSYWKVIDHQQELPDSFFYEIGPRIPDYKPKKK